MRVSPAVDQQCGYAPSTPNPLARAQSVQRPGVAVTRRLIASTNKMLVRIGRDSHQRSIVVGGRYHAVLQHESGDTARSQPARNFGTFFVHHQVVESSASAHDD